MNGFKRQALLISLLDALERHGSWCGETHLQKSVYFLSNGLGVPFDLQFMLYKHGPFSFQLREVLGEMRGGLLIDLESHSPYGPSIHVSEAGRAFVVGFPNTIQDHSQAVNYIAEALGPCSVAELERLSTALYAGLEVPERSEDERAARVSELKPHIPIERAREAVTKATEILSRFSIAHQGVVRHMIPSATL